MNKIMCGLTLIAAMGTSVLLIGCEKEYTATIKNSLPQEFTSYQSDGEAIDTINITEAVVSKVDIIGVDIHIKGEVTYDAIRAVPYGTYLLECKVYDSDGEERYSNGISLDAGDNGTIDCTVNIPVIGTEADDYTIEFCDYYSDIDIELDD